MRSPNLLATKWGRLTAFFFLYLTEGIPLGFAATAVATELRRQGVGPAAIGAFVGSFYLPWAFKWAFGPVVDVFSSERLGRRRMWIVLAQCMMVVTLLSTVGVQLPGQLRLFTILLLIHNTFGATQDVAIDALACGVLSEKERGLANGVMFGAAYLGQIIGGSGVLFLTDYTGFKATFFFVGACILSVTLLVSLHLKEQKGEPRPAVVGSRLAAAGKEIHEFAINSFRAFLGTRGAFNGLFFALVPPGAMCLGLALQSNLAVELGMTNETIAKLGLWSGVISAVSCVLGGMLSDYFGRKRLLSISIGLIGLPVLYMAMMLQRHGWIMPVDVQAANRPAVPAALVFAFWVATLTYSIFQGLMYGTRMALFMDVTTPAVAATQFTAYMALSNLTIVYSAMWQGIAIETWGYPRTMLVDTAFGLVCLALVPMMKMASVTDLEVKRGASRRARGLATALAVLALAWLPYHLTQQQFSQIQPMVNTVFTLVFVGSALFLLASTALLGAQRRAESRVALILGLLLLTMHTRYYLNEIGTLFGDSAKSVFLSFMEAYLYLVPAIAGIFLLYLVGKNHFAAMRFVAEPAAAGATASEAVS